MTTEANRTVPEFPLRVTLAGCDLDLVARAGIHAAGLSGQDGPRSAQLGGLISHHVTQEDQRRKSLDTDEPRDVDLVDIGFAWLWTPAELADALECSDHLARSPTPPAEGEYFTSLHTGLVYLAAGILRTLRPANWSTPPPNIE